MLDLKRSRSSVEGGVATVMQMGVEEQFGVAHVCTGVAHMEEHGWSPFRRAIGHFFIEARARGAQDHACTIPSV